MIDGSPKCVCPETKDCPTSGPGVCGSNEKAYTSECHLRVDACTRKRAIHVVSNGTCGEYETYAVQIFYVIGQHKFELGREPKNLTTFIFNLLRRTYNYSLIRSVFEEDVQVLLHV